MSRIIVKNLPNKVSTKKLTELFSSQGVVTDVQLKHTADGKFRGFAFVGFQTSEQADAAKKTLDKSFINTSQISVDVCKTLDDPTKPKAWSKHSAEAIKLQNKPIKDEPQVKIKKVEKKSKVKDPKVVELLESHKGDVLFEEFMEAHLPDKKSLWKKEKSEFKDEEENDQLLKEADKTISDLDYLQSKKKKDTSKKDATEIKEVNVVAERDRPSIKISNLPCTVKKGDIKEFLKPAKTASIRIPVKMKGIAYCDFLSVAEQKKALNKNRSFMGSRRVLVKAMDREKKQELANASVRRKKEEERLQEAETVAESGRLFIRNLAYTVLETDLRPLFEKFGPITELNIPIDPVSRKPKGFGFVTFVIPENACKALNELDGTIFHGRMLHILPGIAKIDEEADDDIGLSYKQKKLKKQKQQANNKINWNTFFINENCLADAIADNYNTSKENVLTDSSGGGGAAVRMALGETEMIQNTKEFLQNNGVCLKAFENMTNSPRSENVILVKNLPYKTEVSEIRDKFVNFGELSNVLLSPYGGTAIVEFIEAAEARKAFRKLAYSKFKHIPLYLEWAPKTIFDDRNKNQAQPEKEVTSSNNDTVRETAQHVPIDGTTLYVKGINFSTDLSSLKQHFEQCGKVISATLAEKRDPRNPGLKISMGYGFVEFADIESADKALKSLQFSTLDDYKIELKRSNRLTNGSVSDREKKSSGKPSTKIVVRNIPFQATQKEVRDLFKVFGELKAMRLPKKMVGTGSHRGFCFIEYQTINDAKRAFEALSESTHLYGRRLVLSWAATDDDNIETLREKTAKAFSGKAIKRKNIGIDEIPEVEKE